MTGSPSPRWKRVSVDGLPRGVTVLSLPWVGTTWYRRGPGYWRGRLTAVVVLAVVVAVYALLYQLILSDTTHRSGYGTAFWVTVACMAVLIVFGALADWLPRSGVTRVLALLCYLLAPGAWLAALIGQLMPTPPAERVARADLRRQLAERRPG
jgi:hypothetical protein